MRNEKPTPLPSFADSVAGGAATGIVGAFGTAIGTAGNTADSAAAPPPIGTPETRVRKTDSTVREIDAFIRSRSG